jgi:hypothetical protein
MQGAQQKIGSGQGKDESPEWKFIQIRHRVIEAATDPKPIGKSEAIGKVSCFSSWSCR